MQDTLIVVDMQNDFISGALGSEDAQAIVYNVKDKIRAYYNAQKNILFTKDTHLKNYLHTHEGMKLPVEHCIFGTVGWYLSSEMIEGIDGRRPNVTVVNKSAFGYIPLVDILSPNHSFEVCGLCTDICVISNALILRSGFPQSQIVVDAKCCAGTTPERHNAALDVMDSCQIDVINRE